MPLIVENGLTLLVDPDHPVTTGNTILTIDDAGHYQLYKHSPALIPLLPATINPLKKCLVLAENSNYSKTEPGLIATLSSVPYKDFKTGEVIPCDVILPQGMTKDDSGKIISIVYYKWKFEGSGIWSPTKQSLAQVITNTVLNEDLLSELFDTDTPYVKEIKSDTNIIFYDQIYGPSHKSWSNGARTYQIGRYICYESKMQPDNWSLGQQTNRENLKKFNFLKITHDMKKKMDNVSLNNDRDATDKLAGVSKMYIKEGEKHIALYCTIEDCSEYNGYFMQPVPSSSRERKYQIFVPLTYKQARSIGDDCKKSRLKKIPIHKFKRRLYTFSRQNKIDPIKLRRVVVPNSDGSTNHYIISVVKDIDEVSCDPNVYEFSKSNKGRQPIYAENLSSNKRDYHIRGFVVGRCYAALFVKMLTLALFTLIGKVFKNSCSRKLTRHFGTMDIIGTRHSKQSSRTMSQPNQNRHNYFSRTKMNTSLLIFVISLINNLRDQAHQMHMSCGSVLESLVEKAVKSRENRNAEHPSHGIVTKYFSNTNHKDKDWFVLSAFSRLLGYVKSTGNDVLCQYLKRYQYIFPDLWKDKLIPQCTTCCCTLMGKSKGWNMLQYFLFLDLGLAYDQSSDMYSSSVPQLAWTFYGALFGHLTSRPTYVSSDGKWVTTIPPSTWFGLFAWGKYKSPRRSNRLKAQKKKKRKASQL